jgi:glycosyltransferase involved in cell wall biosynthesis
MPPAPRPAPKLVSVIIPVRDDAARLASQLDCLEAQQYEGPWEVIVVVDNDSSDRSGDVARSRTGRFPHLTVVQGTASRGTSYARNAGVTAAQGDLLAFCDADDEVPPGWIAAIARAAREHDLAGGSLDRDALNVGAERAWRPWQGTNDGLPIALDFWPYALSGNCGIWRHVLEGLGYWNQAYQACNDVELSWRAQRAGFRLGFVPDAAVRYRYRSTLRGLARQFFHFGAAEAQLYRDFRCDGLWRNGSEALRVWAWIVVNLPRAVFSLARRGFWVRMTAHRVGRLAGSVRFRVVFP